MLPAYARLIGIEFDHWNGDVPVLTVDYTPNICGNPGTFHGGALGGLLELAALAALRVSLPEQGREAALTPLSSTIEYLRSAGEQRTYAIGQIVRAGRRLANVRASAWQDSRDKLVTTAIFNFAISPG